MSTPQATPKTRRVRLSLVGLTLLFVVCVFALVLTSAATRAAPGWWGRFWNWLAP